MACTLLSPKCWAIKYCRQNSLGNGQKVLILEGLSFNRFTGVNLLPPYGYGDYWYTVDDYATQLIEMTYSLLNIH